MTDERWRLFVALPLPAGVRASLVLWRNAALAAIAGVRVVGSEGLHVTLCFLGSRPVAAVPRVAVALQDPALAGATVPRLTVSGALWLPARRPRVLAVSLTDADGALADIQATLSGALSELGVYEPEGRPFLAHVTVARAARDARLRAVDLDPPPPPLAFAGSEVCLYRSRPGVGGSRYEVLTRGKLGG